MKPLVLYLTCCTASVIEPLSGSSGVVKGTERHAVDNCHSNVGMQSAAVVAMVADKIKLYSDRSGLKPRYGEL